MSRSEYKRKTRRRVQEEGIEGSVEALYERSRGRLVRMAKSDQSSKGTPEWQKNVALATNTAGAAAGPAAVYMAVKQARGKKGGMPRAGVEAVEAKSKPTTRLGRAARATGKVVRNPKAIAAGGAVAVGAQVANTTGDVIAARFLAEDKKKGKAMSNVGKRMSSEDKKKAAYAGGVGAANAVVGGAGAAYMARSLGTDRKTVSPKRSNEATRNTFGPDAAKAVRSASRKARLKATATNPAKAIPANVKSMRPSNRWAMVGAAGLGVPAAVGTLKKSIEQSIVSKSDAVVITGNGNSLVEKRQFDAEADRQRRLGLYTGLGAVGAAGFGAAAAKDVKFQGTDRAKGRLAAVKLKGKPWSKKRVGSKAGLAALAAASAAGGVGAYRRGISERNYPYN